MRKIRLTISGALTLNGVDVRLQFFILEAGAKKEGSTKRAAKPRYFRVVVDDEEHRVNVRIPMKLIRAGIKLSALIPQQAMDVAMEESGIDLSQITPENLDEIVDNLEDFTVDIDGKEKVRVFCE